VSEHDNPKRREQIVVVAVDLVDRSSDWCVRCGTTDLTNAPDSYVGMIYAHQIGKEHSAGTFTRICAQCQFSFVNWFMDSEQLKMVIDQMPPDLQELYQAVKTIVGP